MSVPQSGELYHASLNPNSDTPESDLTPVWGMHTLIPCLLIVLIQIALKFVSRCTTNEML